MTLRSPAVTLPDPPASQLDNLPGVLGDAILEVDLAKHYGTSPRYWWELRRRGKGPAWFKLGGRVYYRRAAVLAYIAAIEKQPVREHRASRRMRRTRIEASADGPRAGLSLRP